MTECASLHDTSTETDVTDSATIILISVNLFFIETKRLSDAGEWTRTRDSPVGTHSSDD
jgi:hypothetical protein